MSRWWRAHSLRRRLTAWYVAVMVVVLGLYAVVVLSIVRRTASNALDDRLRDDFQLAAAMVDQTPEGGIAWAENNVLEVEEERPWVQVWGRAGALLYRSATAEQRLIPVSRALATLSDDNRIITVAVAGEIAPYRILTRRGRVGARPVVIQVAASEATMQAQVRDVMLTLALGLPLAVAVAGLGGYALARSALAPIETMADRARTITAERLSDRLPVENPDDEMGRLATVFNETLGRLERSFEQMRQFTSDVSHELRTPLTSIRSVGEVGLRGQGDAAHFRGVIGSMLEEVDRLTGLVDRLLTLSRAETGQATLSREVIDLSALADNVVAHLSVLAEEKGQQLVVERDAAPSALADLHVLRQALINLVDNAIKFTPVGGRVRVRVSATADEAVCDVVDSGPGVPPDARDHIFDRFYRFGDAASPRGTGLGLSIARGAVEANGGRLTLAASSAAGSTFRIAMPRMAAERARTA
jgi:heavy metal sensor kinase